MEKLSIVLPCYNPQEGWEQRILEAYNSISKKLGFYPEIILVNDGSNKQLSSVALDLLQSAIPQFCYATYPENKGKGYALRHGVGLAQNDLVIYTDIDFPYTTDSLVAIWQSLKSGNDIAVGVKNAAYYRNVPTSRIIISRILRRLIRLFLSMPVTDTQCGLKGFNQKGKTVFLNTTINRYLCDLEFIYKAFKKKYNLKISSIEASLREGIVFRSMNATILINEGISFIKIVLFH